ncbi:AAA-like domain-containing protein [Nostoc sp. FACHB-87]|uniref:AAA-like domain-containing protein n=1 Tax=Nostocaceae TaxID=1162 RepID=UPI001682D40D|nr:MULTISPECIES: AAA-like domain-containing protein [Nostocaceae]MBD2454795.1 AAA-like domain-containing protein [Nostoc sp. FACHB-87]MBD2476747.1 AAA-like domain-containing protein [Anabaena sp. FACHB-83]
MNNYNHYQVGGSLREGTEIYVRRQADSDLYTGLKAGIFCYVLNSRQMGKSSLRVRTMSRLQSEGFVCVAFEMRELCVYQVSADEFYGGFVSHFASELNIEIDLESWWSQNTLLHPFLRLSKFVEEVLLANISQQIIVFVDEIDSILNLEFKDDFFAFVRSCYNKRADKPEFQRLTFALFGVATPTDLIADNKFTPLNVDSRAIELTGFQLSEAKPLEQGLIEVAANPTKVMAEILAWTGGQPFLTQWLCQLINTSNTFIASGWETQAVEAIVRSQMIEHWLANDRQQHFQTIRDRILHNKSLACWSLGLYQQLLNQGELSAEDSWELMQLCLSGLVVKRQGKLSIYNRIYATVFDYTWTEQALRAIRPYGAELAAWEISQDPQYLLQNEALQWALVWAKGLSLSHSDYQFLSASQAQELAIAQSKTQTAIQQETQAIQRLKTVQHQTKKRLQIGAIALSAAVISTIGTFFYFQQSEQQLRTNADILNLEREGSRILQVRADGNQLKDLLGAMKSAQRLKELTKQHSFKHLPTHTPLFALQAVLSTINEQNRWHLESPAVAIAFSRDGQKLATGGEDGAITLWTLQGKKIQTIKTHKTKTLQGFPISISSLSFSPDGQYIVSADSDYEIQVWHLKTGTLVNKLKLDQETLSDVQFTNDNNIVVVNAFGKVAVLNLQWKLLHTRQIAPPQQGIDLTISLEGDAIVFINAQGKPEVRDIKTGALIKTYPNINHNLGERLWHSFRTKDGAYISANLNTLKLWHPDGTLQTEIKTHQLLVAGFSSSFDGSVIATSHPDGMLKLWKIHPQKISTPLTPPIQTPRVVVGNQQRINRIQIPGEKLKIAGAKSDAQNRIMDATLSPDGQTIAATKFNGEMTLYQADGSELRTIQTNLPESVIKFSPDGSRLVLLSIRQQKIQFRLANGDLIQEIDAPHYKPGIEFSPDGKELVISGNQPDKIQLWSSEGKFLKTIKDADSLHFSPNNQTYITVTSGNTPTRTLRLWRRDGQLLKTLSGQPNEITTMGFSPSGQFMVGDRFGKLVIWSAEGNLIQTLNHGAAVIDIAHRNDGQQLATVGIDQNIKLWRSDGTLIRTLETNQIGRFEFSPDGQLLIAKTIDSTIHIWQADGTPITRIPMGGAFNSFLNFTPDGNRLISSSGSMLYSWNLNLDALLTQGCNWLGDYFQNHPQELQQLPSCRN